MDIINTNQINIDIKILNDKYEIFLNNILYKSNNKNIITYLGKDIFTNTKIMIDIYYIDIQLIAKKIINKVININNDNIIEILDIIIEKNITYIIKPYYSQFINKIKNIPLNKTKLLYYFNKILINLEYLYIKNIDIDNLLLDQIFINQNNKKNQNELLISPYFDNNLYPSNIIYGSPIYNCQINNRNKIDIEIKLIQNIYLLFIDLYNTNFNKNINLSIFDNITCANINIDVRIDADIYEIILFLTNNAKFNSFQNIINYFKKYNFQIINTELTDDNTIFNCEI